MIVAGFGFRSAAGVDSLHDALRRAGGAGQVTALATAADKTTSPAFQTFAKELALPVHAISPLALKSPQTATQAPASIAARGTGSVAEAAALCAAGPGARLLQSRVISNDRMATCALAAGETT